jgi:predicted DCC family thiol-disulfide oxidoreductase YuxK
MDSGSRPPYEHLVTPALLYDGNCRFCTAQARRLLRLLPTGSVELLDFQRPTVLARFPDVSFDRAMRAIPYVDERGRVFYGLEGIVRALGLRLAGKLAYVYFVPGIRQLADRVYRAIADNRYRIAGRTCDGDTCALHIDQHRR